MKQSLLLFLLALCISSQAQEGKFIETNGVELYYEIQGKGEPLLLLHGFTMTHEMWIPWIVDFSKKYKVILVDMRGHGKSSNPTNEFTHKESAKDIYGLLDKLGIDKFSAIGFSSGAMTLTHMATMDSVRLQSLILIGSTIYFPEPSRIRQRNANYEKLDPNWLTFMKSVHPGGESQIRQLLLQFNSFAVTYDDMNFTSPYLSTIKCPTLIIHGDRDEHFSVDIPIESYKAIPNSYLWIIPNHNHSSINKGTLWGDIFLKVIEGFLEGEWK